MEMGSRVALGGWRLRFRESAGPVKEVLELWDLPLRLLLVHAASHARVPGRSHHARLRTLAPHSVEAVPAPPRGGCRSLSRRQSMTMRADSWVGLECLCRANTWGYREHMM